MQHSFVAGEKVRIKNENPGDKKRVPHYIRGKVGVVQQIWGRLANPRDHRDDRPPLYSVMFSLRQIWGAGSNNDTVVVDVFEDWMLREAGTKI